MENLPKVKKGRKIAPRLRAKNYILSACIMGLPGAIAAMAPDSVQLRRQYIRPLTGIFWEPSAMFSGYYNGSFRFGAEIAAGYRAAIVLSGGSGWPGGLSAKAGFKRYDRGAEYFDFRKGAFRKIVRRSYIECELSFKQAGYDNQDSLKGVGPRSYHVSKLVFTGSIIFGQIATWRCGLYYEWLAGAGIRYKTVDNDLSEAETANLYHWHEGFVTSLTDARTGGLIAPHIALGLRLGYRFR